VSEVFVVDACRTPIGKVKGALAGVRPDHLAADVIKALVERKPTSQVAQETFHSKEAVEYYVQCFRRIQLCRDNGMSIEDIAQATGHSRHLVREYLDLMKQFQVPPLPNASGSRGGSDNPEARPEREPT